MSLKVSLKPEQIKLTKSTRLWLEEITKSYQKRNPINSLKLIVKEQGRRSLKSAFIIMRMDKEYSEGPEICKTIKEVCKEFGINAVRADGIEHSDIITNLILNKIKTSDYLIANLSGEKPNVYYEVGYAHANHISPILYRRVGTKLHFDLSVHNVPEYENADNLRKLLRKRLRALTAGIE